MADELERQFYDGNPFDINKRRGDGHIDVGDEDWEFPDATELDVPGAIRLWDKLERESREAGARKKRLAARVAAAKELALRVLEDAGQTVGGAEIEGGREVQISPYLWEAFTIKDEAAFKEWAGEQAENFYDATPRLRDDIFLDEMRKLSQDGRPLPPGVIRYDETRISKTARPQRRKRAVEKPDQTE